MASKDCRRRFLRFSSGERVWWEQPHEDVVVSVLNVSVGGMLCQFPVAPAQGERVRLQFQLDNHQPFVFCKARVIHVKPVDRTYQVGLEVLELEGTDPVSFTQALAGVLTSG